MTRPSDCGIGAFEPQGFTLTKSGGDNQSTVISTAFSKPVNGGKVTFTPPGSGASTVITSYCYKIFEKQGGGWQDVANFCGAAAARNGDWILYQGVMAIFNPPGPAGAGFYLE